MSIFKERNYYKPFGYPWAFEAYELQQKMHWLPSEVSLHEDVNDWNNKMSKSEKNLVKQILTFFTQGDVDVAQAYMDVYIPLFKPLEIRMMLSVIATSEANHAHAYSLLNDTVGMDDGEYKAFQEIKAMNDKHEYLWKSKGGTEEEQMIRDMAVFSAFGEGLQLFASFVMLLNFQRFGKMKGMGQIVAWSIRDETHHVESMIKLFHCLLDEKPKVWITPDEVKQYIRHIADRRLLQLGLKPNYGVKDNPLEWVDWVVSGVEHTNFFENRATEYAKGAMTGTWADAF